eukprot:TRINITY_DN81187_c0_g1_i1.p1 TRINITY_DN81187_c0_g1~~TRINITY_DN81187_c0_g1_i1.p1  ORF type:complete len:238 (-),score=45.07 TRINITY_DN81187_c0_g1_i1:45-758(-)
MTKARKQAAAAAMAMVGTVATLFAASPSRVFLEGTAAASSAGTGRWFQQERSYNQRGLHPVSSPHVASLHQLTERKTAEADSAVARKAMLQKRPASVFGMASRFVATAAAAAWAAFPRRKAGESRPRAALRMLRGAAVAMPAGLEAFQQSSIGFMLRLTLLQICKIYMAMLVLRITVMWFPNINPYRQPFYSMMQLTDPYLNLFRGWMPPIFGIDLSVILAFVVIQAVIDTLTISPF